MKSIVDIKNKIIEIHKAWLLTGDSLDDFKDAEYYEQEVKDMLLDYCEEHEYDVKGFPFVHRKLGETNDYYDDDYFSERNDLYILNLANEKDDVFEILHFYWNLFWPDSSDTVESTRNTILDEIQNSELNFDLIDTLQ